jgi:hypothetical protein
VSLVLFAKAMGAQLPTAQKLTLLSLADCADIDGVAWPTIALVASQSGQTIPEAETALLALVDAGIIVIKRPEKQPVGSPNRYRIDTAALERLSQGAQP